MVDLHICTAVISQHIGVAQAQKFILPQLNMEYLNSSLLLI